MNLDIAEFKERLAAQKERSNADLVDFFYQKVRLAENMKAGLMEEMNEQNREFLVNASGTIDAYMFQVKEIEKSMHLQHLPLDQEVALQDNLHDQMIEKINELETLKKEIKKSGSWLPQSSGKQTLLPRLNYSYNGLTQTTIPGATTKLWIYTTTMQKCQNINLYAATVQ